MPVGLHIAIKQCIDAQGVEMLRSVRLANYLADMNAYEDVPATKQVLRTFLASGHGSEIADLYARQLPWQKKMQAFTRELINNYGFRDGLVEYTIECLEFGLGWIDKEPKFDPDAPVVPVGYNKGSFIPDLNKQLGLMQKEYLAMLEQLITVPEGGLYKKSGYYSTNALSQLWVVENKIDIISSALGTNNSDWYKQEKQRVLDKYTQSKEGQLLMVFLKVVIPAIVGFVFILNGISYLSSLKSIAGYRNTMESANAFFESGDYRSALLGYQEAQEAYTGSFAKNKYTNQARESAERASAIIVREVLPTCDDLADVGRFYDAKARLDSLSSLPLDKETVAIVSQKQIALDKTIQTAVINSKVIFPFGIARNKGKLDKADAILLEELLKVSPDDYWLNFIKNKEEKRK